jgi:hypothetical protein
MEEKIILPLNCYVGYDEYDPKKDETYTDSFYLLLKKVSERAILLTQEDFWDGRVRIKCWLPKRFIRKVFKKEVEDGECWLIGVEFREYCEYREWLAKKGKSIKELCTCGVLGMMAYEVEKGVLSPAFKEKPFEEIEEKEPEVEIEDWDYPVPLKLDWEGKRKKPKEVEELEKFLKEFGIKG